MVSFQIVWLVFQQGGHTLLDLPWNMGSLPSSLTIRAQEDAPTCDNRYWSSPRVSPGYFREFPGASPGIANGCHFLPLLLWTARWCFQLLRRSLQMTPDSRSLTEAPGPHPLAFLQAVTCQQFPLSIPSRSTDSPPVLNRYFSSNTLIQILFKYSTQFFYPSSKLGRIL